MHPKKVFFIYFLIPECIKSCNQSWKTCNLQTANFDWKICNVTNVQFFNANNLLQHEFVIFLINANCNCNFSMKIGNMQRCKLQIAIFEFHDKTCNIVPRSWKICLKTGYNVRFRMWKNSEESGFDTHFFNEPTTWVLTFDLSIVSVKLFCSVTSNV